MTSLETALCHHFGVCGGCHCPSKVNDHPAPLPYEEELRLKEERVRALLSPFDVEEWRPIVPSPDPWFYRNKMELAFGQGADATEILAGLREAGRYDRVVDMQTCLLMSVECLEALKRTRDWAREHRLSGYHRRRHQGAIRYLVLREGKNTGQRMGVLILSDPPPSEELRIDLHKRLHPLFSTFWLAYSNSPSDVARTPDMHLQWGPGSIEEKLFDLTFRISAYSFFQTNTRGAEKLYGLLRDWAKGPAFQEGALLDLYCGGGGIGISLARSFDRVVGVDTNAEAIADATFNAEKNSLGNTEFVVTDVEEFLKKLPASKLSIQLAAVVVDPPRPGLQGKALASLLELTPPRIAYVSCNPESLAKDLQSLVPFYRIRSVQAVNLFPHTQHMETFVALEHR